MVSLKALHVEMSEAAVPQYGVALCIERDTRVDTPLLIR
jgi:hypothetical protein